MANPQAPAGDLELRCRQPRHRHSLRQHDPHFVLCTITPAGCCASLNLSSTSTTLSSFSYALDGVGNRQRVVESSGNRVTWSYDKTYQLTNEQRSGSNSYNITYTYDPVGNRPS